MNVGTVAKWAGTFLLSCALGACGGSGGDDTAPPPPPAAGTVVGPAGGTVTGPNGTKVVIPPGALATNTAINIEETSAGAPALPNGLFAAGPMFAFTPHGTTFAVPATVTVPFDPAAVPAGAVPTLFKTSATQSGWVPVLGATAGAATVTGEVTGFSTFLFGYVPHRFWRFWNFPADGGPMKEAEPVKAEFDPVVVDVPHDYGSHNFEFNGIVDGRATGKVFSNATGNTYSVLAESPAGQIGNPDTAIGSLVQLDQFKRFRKLRADATLTLKVTAIRLEAFTFQPTELIPFECLAEPLCKREMSASVEFEVEVYNDSRSVYIRRHGQVELRHVGTILKPVPEWKIVASDYGTQTLWTEDKFRLTDLTVSNTEAQLIAPLPIPFDISGIPFDENNPNVGKFTVRIIAKAKTLNEAQGESFLKAYFRDPVQEGGGELEFTGLEEINDALSLPPEDNPDAVPECTTGIDPAAGVLQFGAPAYAALELQIGGSTPITVTRTGGSRGAVSVAFATGDGTATAGSDYDAVSRTVTFADGDTQPRTVEVPFIVDALGEPDESVNLTLANVRGCATLGAQTSAVLTIVDNDRPRPQNAFSVGGTVTGVVGSGLVLRQATTGENLTPANGPFAFSQLVPTGLPYSVTVATQPGNPVQICTVTNGSGTIAGANITNVAVDCTTPPPNTGLDPAFGAGGKVTASSTGIGNAVALQTDGKIVTAGGAFTLTRHNFDGNLDTTFGVGGKVTTAFGAGSGSANDVAVQSDGKIVVAGSARARAGFASDDHFGLRRYNTDGSLDASFGAGGVVSTDFAGLADSAKAVAIQPDGKIVAFGQAQSTLGVDFAVARYNTDGSLDTTFGNGGTVTTDLVGGTDFGTAMRLQADGKIIVLGKISQAGSSLVGIPALVRYNQDGSLDTGFGTGGKAIDATNAPADGLALQADGKILVAGSLNAGSSSSAFALTRFLPNGTVDPSFGTVSTTFFTSGNGSIGRAVAVQADGKIVVVGEAASGASSTFDVAIARFDPTGTLDATFGTGGKLLVDFFANTDSAQDVVVQPDGKIVVAGSARNGSLSEFALLRLNR